MFRSLYFLRYVFVGMTAFNMHHASAVLTDLKLNTIKMQNNTLLLVTTNRFIGSENIALHKRDRR